MYLSHDIHTESQWLNMCFARNLIERFFSISESYFYQHESDECKEIWALSILPPSSNSAINIPIVLNKYHTIRNISWSTCPTISPSLYYVNSKMIPRITMFLGARKYFIDHRCSNFFVNVVVMNHPLPAETPTHAHVTSTCTS